MNQTRGGTPRGPVFDGRGMQAESGGTRASLPGSRGEGILVCQRRAPSAALGEEGPNQDGSLRYVINSRRELCQRHRGDWGPSRCWTEEWGLPLAHSLTPSNLASSLALGSHDFFLDWPEWVQFSFGVVLNSTSCGKRP